MLVASFIDVQRFGEEARLDLNQPGGRIRTGDCVVQISDISKHHCRELIEGRLLASLKQDP